MSTSFEDLDRRLTAVEDVIEQGPDSWNSRGSSWVTDTTSRLRRIEDTQADHTVALNRIDRRIDKVQEKLDGLTEQLARVSTRLHRIEEALAGHTDELAGIKTTLERLTRAVERLAGPGDPGTPG